MLDESQRLRDNPHLLSLLSHYAQQGTEDRATWRDRLMQMEGIEPKQLSALHGSLMAFDWIEQNTGQALMLANGTLSACYRITLNGLREYGRFHGIKIEEKAPETPEKKGPRFPRKKKQESDLSEAPIIAASEESPETTETPDKKKQQSDSIEVPVVADSEGLSETAEKKGPKFPRKKKQESDLPEAPVDAASEGSPEATETTESPEKKNPKFPKKKKQKSDSPEVPEVAPLEESLVPAA